MSSKSKLAVAVAGAMIAFTGAAGAQENHPDAKPDALVVWAPRPQQMEKAAYLGLSTSPVTGALREQLKLAKGIGLVVDYVEPGSPADLAGIKQYDVLEKLNDQLLINGHQLAVLVRNFKPGESARFTVRRQGEQMVLEAKFVEREVAALDDNSPWGAPPAPWNNPRVVNLRDLAGAARQGPPFALIQNLGASATTAWSDGQHKLTVTTTGGPDGQERHLVAEDVPSGKKLFDGPINTPEQRKAVPADIAKKLEKLEASSKIELKVQGGPATQPASGVRIRIGTP